MDYKMDFKIDHPKLAGTNCRLVAKSKWSALMIVTDQQGPTKAKWGKFTVSGANGQEVIIKLNPNFLDPFAKVTVDGETVQLQEKLPFYEMALIFIPFALVPLGGAIGGALGVFTALFNGRTLRSDKPPLVKYGMTIGAIVAAFGLWGVIAFAIHG